MTIQLATARHGTSKAVLQAALTAGARSVVFADPSIFNPRSFYGTEIQPGESFACVLDPATRRRFCTVKRLADGTFKVT